MLEIVKDTLTLLQVNRSCIVVYTSIDVSFALMNTEQISLTILSNARDIRPGRDEFSEFPQRDLKHYP